MDKLATLVGYDLAKKRISEVKLLSLILNYGSLNASELARISGYSRSWVWKTLRRLEKEKVVRLEKKGGTLVAYPAEKSHKKLLRIGLLKASEYPYIIPFARRLKNHYSEIEILVYDEAFKLAYDIALGKVQLGMAPAISHLIVHRISGGLSYIFAGGSKGGAGIIEGRKGEGHVTTMASSMELCSELNHLPHPRIYLRKGEDIIRYVKKGQARYGVVWEPFLYQAARNGLKTRPCDLPFCCLLGGNANLKEDHETISKLFEQAVAEARRRIDDPVLIDAYANIIGIDRTLVKNTVKSYEYLESPPMNDLSKLLGILKDVAFPAWILRQAIL